VLEDINFSVHVVYLNNKTLQVLPFVRCTCRVCITEAVLLKYGNLVFKEVPPREVIMSWM